MDALESRRVSCERHSGIEWVRDRARKWMHDEDELAVQEAAGNEWVQDRARKRMHDEDKLAVQEAAGIKWVRDRVRERMHLRIRRALCEKRLGRSGCRIEWGNGCVQVVTLSRA